jgi:porin
MRGRAGRYLVALVLLCPAAAAASDPAPILSIAARETVDAWGVAQGIDPGGAVLSKLQVSATITGDDLGLPGWSVHAQIYRFDGQALSSRMGDIQTADNLEAVPVTRLFEAWIAKQWGRENHSVALRAGLIDLNSQFDSIDPASLFINSSHGIGPDLSRSGVNGPSIYPVSALGATITLVPSARWTLRAGLLDGVAGDPDHPRAFAAERLGAGDGVLAIVQADYQLGKMSRVEVGAWNYSTQVVGVNRGFAHDRGLYASLEAPLPLAPRTMAWLRAGYADDRAQAVAGYLGLGAIQTGTFAGRSEDRVGLAIAHAIIGSPAACAAGISRAETSIELSYQVKLSDTFAVQPDVQYIIHPAGIADAPDALGFGLRLVVTTGFPKKAKATDATDPTVPPDGAPTTAPADGGQAPP